MRYILLLLLTTVLCSCATTSPKLTSQSLPPPVGKPVPPGAT